MATYNKFLPATEQMNEGMNAGSDSWKVVLATNLANTDTTITAEVANGNGYTTGGNTAATTSATTTAGVFKLILASPAAWTATGAGFTFRYAILYNSTTSTPVGYWDYGSSQAVAAGETVTVTLDAVNGVYTVT
jgi:hypothetical protein